VECYPEEVLVRELGFSNVEHQPNKPELVKRLERLEKRGHGPVVGIIDEDPGAAQPSYLRRLRPVVSQHGFMVLRSPSSRIGVIVLCPRHEAWVYSMARAHGFDVRDYGLPGDWREFHKHLHAGRRPRAKLLERYVRLLKDMLAIGCPALKALRDALRALLGR